MTESITMHTHNDLFGMQRIQSVDRATYNDSPTHHTMDEEAMHTHIALCSETELFGSWDVLHLGIVKFDYPLSI
jgi:hypothetical protein